MHLSSFQAFPLKATCGCVGEKAIYVAHLNTGDVPAFALLSPHKTDSPFTGRTFHVTVIPMSMCFSVFLRPKALPEYV